MSMVQVTHPVYGLLPINVTPESVAASSDETLMKVLGSTLKQIEAGFGSEMTQAYRCLLRDEALRRGLA